jgi:hypothetical protein
MAICNQAFDQCFEISMAIKIPGKEKRSLDLLLRQHLANVSPAISERIAGENQGDFLFGAVAANDAAVIVSEGRVKLL